MSKKVLHAVNTDFNEFDFRFESIFGMKMPLLVRFSPSGWYHQERPADSGAAVVEEVEEVEKVETRRITDGVRHGHINELKVPYITGGKGVRLKS